MAIIENPTQWPTPDLTVHTSTTDALVHCVIVCDEGRAVHIFSTAEKAEAFADAQDVPCVVYDYVIDHPERMEDRAQ